MNFFYIFINFKLTRKLNMRVLWVDDDCGMIELFHIQFAVLSMKLLFSSIFISKKKFAKKNLLDKKSVIKS